MSYAGKNPGILRTKGEKGVISSTALIQSTHQATVNALALPLGKKAPKVYVGGNGYCIVAYFPCRLLIDRLCNFARNYPEKAMTRDDLRQIVDEVNYAPNQDWRLQPEHKRIHIAGLPEQASRNVKAAAIAGCIHEEGHDLFTRQEKLDFEEIASIVLPRWNAVTNWAPYKGLLLQAANIFEDIYIERLLCALYPGVRGKMAALQDFILTMEDKGRTEAGADLTPISALMGLIRDVGLGYKTDLQRKAVNSYREAHADVCDLMLTGKGQTILRDSIPNVSTSESIKEARVDNLGSTRLALDLIILMEEVGGAPPQEPEGEGEGQGKACCPNCKAPASKLRTKAVKDDDTKIAITCTACGWQEVMDKPEPQEGGNCEGDDDGIAIELPPEDGQEGQQGNGKPPKDTIRFDDSEEADDESKAGEAQEDDESEDGEGEGEGSESDESEGDDTKGEDESDTKGEDESEGEGSEDGEGEDSDSDGDSDTEGEDGDGGESDDGDHIDNLWDDARPEPNTEDLDSKADDGKGGGNQWGAADGNTDNVAQEDLLGSLIDSIAANGEADLMDYAQALGGESEAEIQEALKHDVRDGERAWNPQTTAGDRILWPDANDDWAKAAGRKITKSVRRECSYLLARLRQIVMGQDEVIVEEGCPKGRKLSSRNLANTYAQVTNFERPDRAFKRVDEEELPSTAATVCVDESGSMYNILTEAGQVASAIAMPLDALGAKVMVHGIRSGGRNVPHNPQQGYRSNCHRSGGVTHDIIKGFDESYRQAEARFSKLQADGGTPLSDGIQFAMDNLEYRDEDNKVIFVVTDGWPNGGHVPVINRQIRLAKERGWHMVGVGVGADAQYVQSLFPDSVYSPTVSEIPKLLVKKLNELMSNGTVQRRSVKSA